MITADLTQNITNRLVTEINSLLFHLYGEGLDDEEKRVYSTIPIEDLRDLKFKLIVKVD
jgi:hypothetical protein